MLRKLMGLVLALTLVLAVNSDVDAGKSGPSFSGGSRTSTSRGPSFSGGSKGVSTPKFSGGSKSSSSTSNKPSFSGGSKSPSSTSGKPSFSGGSKTVTTTPIQGRTPTSVSKKPAAESFDRLSTTEARKTESRKAYERSEAPAPSYKTPAGKSVNISRDDKHAAYLRGRLDESHWQNRNQRVDVFYGGYYNRYPTHTLIVYNDYYHPYWNYWLLSQSMDVMSLWLYHHQRSMDQARINYMYSQNAELRARVAALERQGIPRDPNYTPKGVDPDMMYDDGYVNAVVNPRPRMVDHYEYDDEGHAGWVLWVFVFIPLLILSLVLLYWLMFRYRY